MGLTRAQFARAAAQEASAQRMAQLVRMSYGQLHTLFTGDQAEAAVWIHTAAEHGVPAAQLRLGAMLLEGTGIARDAQAALPWFARAAAQGDAQAMNMLGRCYENGWGAAIDLVQAAAQYRACAVADHDWGQYNLGNLLFDGRGVTRDVPLALRWYLRAARQGHSRAMNLIGRCLEEGWGCRRSPEDAAYWYRRSAQAGYFRGQFNYASVLAGRGASAEAAAWFLKAATGGDTAIRQATLKALAQADDPVMTATRLQVQALAPDPQPGHLAGRPRPSRGPGRLGYCTGGSVSDVPA